MMMFSRGVPSFGIPSSIWRDWWYRGSCRNTDPCRRCHRRCRRRRTRGGDDDFRLPVRFDRGGRIRRGDEP